MSGHSYSGRALHNVDRSEPRKPTVMGVHKQGKRIMATNAALAQKLNQRGHQIITERNDTLLSALSTQENLSPWAFESKVDRIDVKRFRHACPSARKKENQRAIASTYRCTRIRSCH